MWYNVRMSGIWILVTFLLGTTVAHVIKLIRAIVSGEVHGIKEVLPVMYRSGGMPSGHSASIVAAATLAGLAYGWTSVEFAILMCVGIDVMYDAVNVRYAVGEQGMVMNKILKKVGSDREMVKIVRGHTIKAVLAGMVVGAIVGATMFFIVV